MMGNGLRPSISFTTLSIGAVLISGAGEAQTVVPTSLEELTRTASYQANIARLFALLSSDVFRRCPTLVSTGSQVTVIEPASFDHGHVVSGSWKQSFPVRGCGNDTSINFFFQAKPEGISSTIAAPGETQAGLVLQRDAFRYVVLAIRAKEVKCTELNLRTTSFDGIPGKDHTISSRGTGVGAWAETWTTSACGKIYRVRLTFVPDATGTVITAGPATILE